MNERFDPSSHDAPNKKEQVRAMVVHAENVGKNLCVIIPKDAPLQMMVGIARFELQKIGGVLPEGSVDDCLIDLGIVDSGNERKIMKYVSSIPGTQIPTKEEIHSLLATDILDE